MIRSTKDLLTEVENFADSHDLAEALHRIAEAGEIDANGQDAYYLREAAVHIKSMHDLVQDLARALKEELKKLGHQFP